MGEAADAMIDGDDCQLCGMPLDGPGDGFPRTCVECGGDAPLFDDDDEEIEP